MLTIQDDGVESNPLLLAAFRLSFLRTLERMEKAAEAGCDPNACLGYLPEVPFLKEVAPRVQLDVLLDTWQKQRSITRCPATLLDEAVLYAAYRHAAAFADEQPAVAARAAVLSEQARWSSDGVELSRGLRDVRLLVAAGGPLMTMTRFLDISPTVAEPMLEELDLPRRRTQPLFDVLGRWHIYGDVARRADGLLSPTEMRRAERAMGPAGQRAGSGIRA